MDRKEIEKLLEGIALGRFSPEEGLKQLSHLPFLNIGSARLDGHRPLRNGFSEVIFGTGKSYKQLAEIISALKNQGRNIFGTRVKPDEGTRLASEFSGLHYDPLSSTFRLIQKEIRPQKGRVAILSAGTADLPVSEEVFRTAEFYGFEPSRCYDVGVAGLQRLLSQKAELENTDVLIVVAGMEGALPSVVGGLFPQPIIAVPTSIGYGTHLQGLTTLMAMLCSCAEGITVVNIDNGFGAACAAIRILSSRS